MPDIGIDSRSMDLTNSTTAAIMFSGSDVGGAVGMSYECKLVENVYSACTSSTSITGLGDGLHIFYVWAVDTAGNKDPSPAYCIERIDTTPLDVPIRLTANGSAIEGSKITVTWQSVYVGCS